jgi:hypothetical protein
MLTCPTTASASGALAVAAPITVPPGAAKDLAGASIAAELHTTLPTMPVTISCAADIVPSGYLALGPAVSFDPERTASDRPFLFTLPYKAARLPMGAGSRQIRIVAKRAGMGPGTTPFFPAVVNVTFDDTDPFASRVTFRAEELATYQVVTATDAGTPVTRHQKYRALAGISMGGGAALSTGIRSGRFDIIGSLGGEPGLDARYFGNMIRDYMFGGFCTAADVAAGHGAIGQLCLDQQRPPLADQFERKSDYEHFLYQDGGGVGLTLRRSLYMQGMRDISRAYGNPAYYNPMDAYLPPGIPTSWLTRTLADRCANPVVLTNFYDRNFNPDGSKPVITFCDGGDSDTLGKGVFDPSLPQMDPPEVALAVDVNGNGVRDSGEPVIVQGTEPYQDVGADGIADKDEPGYDPVTNPDPAGDDYHWQKNPLGTENDGTWEQGEPYEDVGLDGVAGTCQTPMAGCYDYGEGDGKWTVSPNLDAHWYNIDAATLYENLSQDARNSLSIWTDAGIRDFLNSDVCANNMAGRLSAQGAPMRVYDDFPSLGHQPNGDYDFDLVDWNALPDNTYVRYGNPDASDALINMGDGRHVGTAVQVVNRVTSLFAYINSRWPNGDRAVENPLPTDLRGGQMFTGTSGRVNPFAIAVPPGYDQHPELRYPVIYFMHGYGQKPDDLIALSAIFANFMVDETRPVEKRFQKFIIVYVDGRCRPGGSLPLDGTGDQCEQGTFYTNSPVAGHAQMDQELSELMDYIDANYRTKAAEDVQVVP